MKREHEIQKREIHCLRFRSRAYWIVGDNSQTRKIVFRCVRWCEIPNLTRKYGTTENGVNIGRLFVIRERQSDIRRYRLC